MSEVAVRRHKQHEPPPNPRLKCTHTTSYSHKQHITPTPNTPVTNTPSDLSPPPVVAVAVRRRTGPHTPSSRTYAGWWCSHMGTQPTFTHVPPAGKGRRRNRKEGTNLLTVDAEVQKAVLTVDRVGRVQTASRQADEERQRRMLIFNTGRRFWLVKPGKGIQKETTP